MTLPNDTDLNNQDDYLNTDENKTTQDAINTESAKFNPNEQAKDVNDRDAVEYRDAQNLETGASDQPDPNPSPLTTQGSYEEVEENMGGSTNLTLDQLKKEGDPEGTDGQ